MSSRGKIFLTDNWNIGTSKICYCTKRNLQPKKGIWLIQGHSQGQHAQGCLLCARRGESPCLLCFPYPFPSNSFSIFHFTVLLFGVGG